MLLAVLILIWFFLLLYFTFWNLQALSKVHPLSWEAVSLVFVYVVVFTVSLLILLIVIMITLIRIEAKNTTRWLYGKEGANNLCFRGFTDYWLLLVMLGLAQQLLALP